MVEVQELVQPTTLTEPAIVQRGELQQKTPMHPEDQAALNWAQEQTEASRVPGAVVAKFVDSVPNGNKYDFASDPKLKDRWQPVINPNPNQAIKTIFLRKDTPRHRPGIQAIRAGIKFAQQLTNIHAGEAQELVMLVPCPGFEQQSDDSYTFSYTESQLLTLKQSQFAQLQKLLEDN